ncbi:MAG: hypothetical protein LBO74_17415 [Candidatus Symbiothrix sp.]|nr:hypothetical protein [Candidatus Symbiothrix sp.]
MGKVEGINDLITFEGKTVQELISAFRYVVDEHIKDCENENIAVAITARIHGQSLNQFVNNALINSVQVGNMAHQ